MKYLILGGGGVFANNYAGYLLENENQVVAVGRNPRGPSHFSLDVGRGDPNYNYHQIHMAFEQKRLFSLIEKEKPDYIVNFAALAYANSWVDADLYYQTNCFAVVQLVEFLKGKDYLKRFIQIGSSEVYGSTESPAREDDHPHPTSPYAVSKLAADLHLKTMNVPMNIIRPSNCYGPGQYTYRIIPKAILYLMAGKQFPLEGGGVAEKSFMHTWDLSTAIQTVIDKGQEGQIYNVGSERPVTMRHLVDIIGEQLGAKDYIKEVPGRPIEDKRYWINSDKIKGLGWKESISLENGIVDMIEWCEKYPGLYEEADTFTLRA